jgi:hypothetical protein
MVIGLSVGMLGMQGTLKTSATLAITAPAVVMTLPLFDVVAAIVRRRLSGRRIDLPDRLHIHHRLLQRGWTPWQVLCLLGTLCLLTGAAAAAATIFRRDALAWITAMTLIVLMIRLRLFGHHEFALAKRAVIRVLSWYSLTRRFRTLNPGPRGGKRGQAPFVRSTRRAVPANGACPPFPPIPAPDLWDRFIRDLLTWDVREAEFRASRGDRLRYLRWIDPRARLDQPCRWSLSVSIPGRDGELCQLQTAGPRPPSGSDRLAALTLLLKDYGSQFAAHAEMLFGRPVASEHLSHQRKAA